MPHLVIQYSPNLEEALCERELVPVLHARALETGVFPLGGMRTRAIRCDHVAIADAHPENAFLDLQLRIGAGRDAETKRSVGAVLMETVEATLKETRHWACLAVSLEIVEIDREFSWRRNSIHDRLRERGDDRKAAS